MRERGFVWQIVFVKEAWPNSEKDWRFYWVWTASVFHLGPRDLGGIRGRRRAKQPEVKNKEAAKDQASIFLIF